MIIVGNINTSLSRVDRTTEQKIRKDIEKLWGFRCIRN